MQTTLIAILLSPTVSSTCGSVGAAGLLTGTCFAVLSPPRWGRRRLRRPVSGRARVPGKR